jgi:hypothetical protein
MIPRGTLELIELNDCVEHVQLSERCISNLCRDPAPPLSGRQSTISVPGLASRIFRMLVISASDEDLVLPRRSIRNGGCSRAGDNNREVSNDFRKSHPRHDTQSARESDPWQRRAMREELERHSSPVLPHAEVRVRNCSYVPVGITAWRSAVRPRANARVSSVETRSYAGASPRTPPIRRLIRAPRAMAA